MSFRQGQRYLDGNRRLLAELLPVSGLGEIGYRLPESTKWSGGWPAGDAPKPRPVPSPTC